MAEAVRLVGGPMDGTMLAVEDGQDVVHVDMLGASMTGPWDEREDVAVPIVSATYERSEGLEGVLAVMVYRGPVV